MSVYLVHFEQPYEHALHYVGYCGSITGLPSRMQYHRTGRGSRLLKAVTEAGIAWSVVRVWPDADRNYERRLKGHAGTRYCPACAGEKAWRSGAWLPSRPYLVVVDHGGAHVAATDQDPAVNHGAVRASP